MFAIRRIAFRALPVLVLAFAAFVVLGDALHLADRSAAATEQATEQVTEAGIKLCAATAAAVLLSAGVGRARKPALNRRPLHGLAYYRVGRPRAYRKPPPPDIPITLLLQVIRA